MIVGIVYALKGGGDAEARSVAPSARVPARDIMTRSTVVGVLLACASLVASTADAQRKASADIMDLTGKKVGEAILEQRDNGLQISASFTGLPPGPHAFHIHEVAKCDPPFESAGGHFNPTGKQHGKDNPAGPHAGDLPNLEVPSSGGVKVELTVKDVSLDGGQAGLLADAGAALVVHEGADDYKSDPAGNAGKRLACGVIRR
jgi:Cu-Zn family superoxide dismutase